MYDFYDEIISVAKKALDCFDETEELLEYPEVQADKAYYLSVLSKYNNLKAINDKLCELQSAREEEKALRSLLYEENSKEDTIAIHFELIDLSNKAWRAASFLSDALGCTHAEQRAYCRLKMKEGSCQTGLDLFNLINDNLWARGARIEEESYITAKSGYVKEISCIFHGKDVLTRLMPLIGAHKVYLEQGGSEELCFAVTAAPSVEKISENDLKIDVFHSHGAGGQNINKVETAIRVTHLPTGLSVVCQDERSQLKNKKRALETIEKRFKEMQEQSEKKRIEAEISAQFAKKNTPLSFDAANLTMTDTRLKSFTKVPFPLGDEKFNLYLNGLIAL